jgi:hypothetical protein
LGSQLKIRTQNVTDKNQPKLNPWMPNPILLLFYAFVKISGKNFLEQKIDFRTYNLDSKNNRKFYFIVHNDEVQIKRFDFFPLKF